MKFSNKIEDILKNKKILVVEDDKINQTLIKLLLKKSNAIVFTAKNKKELFSVLEQEKYKIDLILLDYLLENNEDGIEILKELKETSSQDIPTIFLTGSIEEEILEKAYQNGAIDFIQKPYKKSEILLRTKTHIHLYSLLEDFKKLAHYDTLTQIFNRRRFFELGIPIFNNNNKVFACMLDIDNFKKINDVYGHDIGDEVIKTFAKTLTETINDKDIVARFGGEEFTIIGTYKNKEEIEILGNKLLQNIRTIIINKNDINISFTASIGISFKNKNTSSIDKLLKETDLALYHVKNNGKDNYIFYENINEKINKIPEKIRTRK